MFFYDYFRKEKFNDKKPYIGEWQTIKRRKQKEQIMIYKTLYRKQKIEQRNPTKPEIVNSSCYISDTRHVTFIKNPVTSHEWEKDRIVIITSLVICDIYIM